MFLKLFGYDQQEQVRGIIALCLFIILTAMMVLIIVAPLGNVKSNFSLNFEVVTLLGNLVTLCLGYLAGEMQGKKSEKKDGKT